MTRIPLSVRIGSRLARCFSHSFIISASLPDPFIIVANGIINAVISPAETSFPAIPVPINCSTNGSKYRIPIRYITNMAAELIPVLTRTALIYSSQSRSLSSSLCRSEVFFLRNIFRPLGNFPLRKRYTFSELLMKIGVVKDVMTDTHTTTGYRKSLITPSDIPRVATIKENSPICTMLNPPRTAVCRD